MHENRCAVIWICGKLYAFRTNVTLISGVCWSDWCYVYMYHVCRCEYTILLILCLDADFYSVKSYEKNINQSIVKGFVLRNRELIYSDIRKCKFFVAFLPRNKSPIKLTWMSFTLTRHRHRILYRKKHHGYNSWVVMLYCTNVFIKWLFYQRTRCKCKK